MTVVLPIVYPSKDLLLRVPPGTVESWAYSRVNNTKLLDALYFNIEPAKFRRGTVRTRERLEWIHQIRALRKSYFEEAWNHSWIRPYLEQTSASRFRHAADIEPVGFLLHWKTDQRMTVPFRISSKTFTSDHSLSHLYETFRQIQNGKYSLYCINDSMPMPHSQSLETYKLLLSTMLPHQQHFPQSPATKRILQTIKQEAVSQSSNGISAVKSSLSKDRIASMGHIQK